LAAALDAGRSAARTDAPECQPEPTWASREWALSWALSKSLARLESATPQVPVAR
jgi:hypothetical protein